MNLFWVYIISLSVLWAQGCGSKKNISKSAQSKDYQSDTTYINQDTIPKPSPPPPGLPPGQAKIKGQIIALHKNGEDSTISSLTLKINRVLGYGSSTPPIAAQDSILVRSINLHQNDIQIGKFVTAVLSYQLMLHESGEFSRWSLVKLEKDSN